MKGGKKHVATKLCAECGIEKPVAEFYLRSGTTKPLSKCKECTRTEMRERYRQRRERQGHTVVSRAEFERRTYRRADRMRLCRRCGRWRHYPEFPLDRKTGRRTSPCKACLRKAARERIRRAPEAHAARSAEWARSHPEKRRAIQRRCYRRARLKLKDHDAVRKETRKLRDLGVVRQSDTCIQCGASPTLLHHETYDDVVNVLSLCPRCHMRGHYKEWRKHGGGPVKYPWEYDEE